MGDGEKKEREKHQCERNNVWLPPACALTRDGTYNPGMCPDWNGTRNLCNDAQTN